MIDIEPLPTPSSRPTADVVVFDSDCRFCRTQVRRLRRLGGRRLAFLSLQDPETSRRCPDLTREQLMLQMYVLDPKGGRHGGADAVRYLSRRLPLLWPLAPVLHFPGSGPFWRWCYARVAASRYGLSGAACDSGGCRIPDSSGDPTK